MTITEEHLESLDDYELRELALRIVDDAATALTTELDGELGVDAAPARNAVDYLRGMLSEPDTGDEPGSFDEVAYRSYTDALTDFSNRVSEAGKSSVADPAEFSPWLNSQVLLSVLGSVACFGDNDVTDRRPDHRCLHEALFRYGQGFLPPHDTDVAYIVRGIRPYVSTGSEIDIYTDDPRVAEIVESYLRTGYYDSLAEAARHAYEALWFWPTESLADLSRRDLLGLVREIAEDAEACYNPDRLGVTVDVLDEAATALKKNLADYPDVDSGPVLQAIDYAYELLGSAHFSLYGYDSDEYNQHGSALRDFVNLAHAIGYKRDNDEEVLGYSEYRGSEDDYDPDHFPLLRDAVTITELFARIESIAIFDECVAYLRYIADGGAVDTGVCFNLSEAMDDCVYRYEGDEFRKAVSAVDFCLMMFSEQSVVAAEYYPRRWDWRMFGMAVGYACELRNQSPLRYSLSYVIRITPGCENTNSRLVALAESRFDSGWDATLVNAVDFAQRTLAGEEAS